jgi:hypothetical protein
LYCCLLGRTKSVGGVTFGARFLHRLQGLQSHSIAAGSGKQSLRTEGVPRPDFSPGPLGEQFFGTVARGTEPAGLCLLLPVEQQDPWDLLT